WRFEYDINFTQTEYMNVPAKGRITWAKDDKGNISGCDHDQILLKRYTSAEYPTLYYSFWDTGLASVEVKMFTGRCAQNKEEGVLAEGRLETELAGAFIIKNNV